MVTLPGASMACVDEVMFGVIYVQLWYSGSMYAQWAQHITLKETRRWWGDPMTVTQVTASHLECLAHLARMPEHRIPQKCLFGWLRTYLSRIHRGARPVDGGM